MKDQDRQAVELVDEIRDAVPLPQFFLRKDQNAEAQKVRRCRQDVLG
jgi:hypothetical protein